MFMKAALPKKEVIPIPDLDAAVHMSCRCAYLHGGSRCAFTTGEPVDLEKLGEECPIRVIDRKTDEALKRSRKAKQRAPRRRGAVRQ